MNSKNIRRLTIGLLVCACAFIAGLIRQNKHAQRSPESTAPNLANRGASVPVVKLNQPSMQSPAATLSPSTVRNFQVISDPESAPFWAVKYGQEFWRGRTQTAPDDDIANSRPSLLKPPFSVGDVVERVSHALNTDPATGVPQIATATYNARFDEQGLEFSPSRPALAGTQVAAADPSTQILFQTVSIEHGGQTYFSDGQNPTGWTVTGNTVQGLLSSSGGMVEHFEAANDGVAVTWVFPEPLPGGGPIDITASVDGLNYAGQTDLGTHFADNSGVARVYVGQAEAVDSLGNRWALTTSAGAGGTLRVEVPEAVQDEAVFPLVVDPMIGPEFGVDNPVSTAAFGNQQNAAITCGSGMYFVTWQDNRNSANTGTDIYGARVSNAGAILDPFGIGICTTGTAQGKSSVAVSVTTFLVTWVDGRLGGNDIFGARVSSTGTVLDPLGLAISFDPAQNLKANPSVAGGPGGFFATWEDNRPSLAFTQIFGARVSAAGAILDPLGINVCTNAANQLHPTVVCNSNSYFVAWEDYRNNGTTLADIYCGRVGTNGIPMDTNGVALCTVTNNQTTPAAANNHGTVLVAWRDQRVSKNRTNDIYGTLVNFTNGTINVLDTNGFAICSNGVSTNPAVCALTNGFLAVWVDGRQKAISGADIFGARVDTNGNVLDVNGIAICTNTGNQLTPAVAGNSSEAVVVWTDPRNSADAGNDIYGARVSMLGVLEDPSGILVSKSGSEESSPAVAFNGTNYLVVWQDERNFMTNSADILGARVSAAGAVLDLHGIDVCTQPGAQQHPSVGASSGGEFLVAWEDSRNLAFDGVDIYGTRVTGAGAVMDPAGLALSASADDKLAPSVSGNQSTFLVAWNDTQDVTFANTPGIYGTLVSQGGSISNPGGFAIAAYSGNEMSPSIAANFNQFLVAFEDSSGPDVFAARVANNGTVLDPGVARLQLGFNGTEFTPAAASLGTNYLVAWADSRNLNSDIYAARVMDDGTTPDSNPGPPISGFPVANSLNNEINPAVAADVNTGTYVVAWQDQGATDGNDLFSARIGTNGTVLDTWVVPLQGTADRTTPQLAYGGAGKFLLVSEAFRPTNSGVVVGSIVSGAPPVANLTVQFSAPTYSVSESKSKFALITVKVTGKYTGELTVDFATADGTAVAGTDYMPVAGRLVFSSKKTTATAMVPIINNGQASNKTVSLILQNPMGGVMLGAQPTATLTILE